MVTRVRLHPGGFGLLLPSATPVISPGVEQQRSQEVALGTFGEEATDSPIHPAAPWSIDSNRFCLRELTRGRRPLCNTCGGRNPGTMANTPARPGPSAPDPHCQGPPSGSGVQMGEGDAGGGDTYPAAPSPPPATAEPAAPGTIFRHRLVLSGGYQPPIRHCQPTQPPVSRAPARPPRPRTTGRREGSGRKRTQSGPSALVRGPGISGTAASQSRGARATRGPRNSAEGLAGPRTRPRLGLLLSTPTLPPRSTPGNGQLRGRGAPGGVGYGLRRTGSP